MTISILGAGAFGTALGISLASKGPVTLWARQLGEMATKRQNTARLPDCDFPESLQVTEDIVDATKPDTILLAVPMQQLRGFLMLHAPLLRNKRLVACCKGIELGSGKGPIAVIEETIVDTWPAILTGPSFANDIARGLPTALTLACKDDTVGAALQSMLTTPDLRLYRTTDTIGAELGGALKNVVAIACGAAIGAGLGESARAALMTRGFAEMQRFAANRSADPATLAGLSGFGDLTLTCTSTLSRNYRLGLAFGQGKVMDQSVTVEGAATAQAVSALAQTETLDMPITTAVAGLIEGSLDVKSAMHALLNRPLKEE